MIKVILLSVIFSSMNVFSQKEVRREYNYMFIIEKGKDKEKYEGETVFFFNYKNQQRLKIIMSDGKVCYYTQVGNFKTDVFKDVRSKVDHKVSARKIY